MEKHFLTVRIKNGCKRRKESTLVLFTSPNRIIKQYAILATTYTDIIILLCRLHFIIITCIYYTWYMHIAHAHHGPSDAEEFQGWV